MKKFFLFLTLLTLSVGQMWGATATIQGNCWGTAAQSYQTDTRNFTDEQGNTWTATGYGVTANTAVIIGKGGANYLQTPEFSGNISSIKVTWSGNTSYYLALQTTNGTELEAKSNPSTATEATFTVSGSYKQLRLVGRRSSGTSNAAATITKVVVTYGSSCTPLTMSAVTATPGNAQIALSWPNVANASSYTVTCKVKSSGASAGTVGGVTGTTTKSCTITGLANGTEYTWSVMPVGTGSYCAENTPATGDATPNVSRTITYYDKDGQHSTSLTDGTNIATALNALYGVGGPTSCNTTDYNYFVGWKDGEIGGTATSVTLLSTEIVNATTAAKSYYAVWSDKDPSSGSWTQVTSVAVGDKVVIAQIDDGTKEMDAFNASATTANNYGTGATFSTNPAGTMIWTVEAGYSEGSFAFKNSSNYYLRAPSTNNNYLYGSTTKDNYSSWTIATSSSRAQVTNVGASTRVLMWNKTNTRFSTYAGKTHGNNSGSYYYYVIFYKQSSVSANYITTCCTELGQINGSVSEIHPTSTKIIWNNVANVSSWTLQKKASVDQDYSDVWASKTGSDSEITIYSDGGTNNKCSTEVVLSCGTVYSFKLIANPASGYCEALQVLDNSGSGYNSGQWTVTTTGVTNVTPNSAFPETTCDGFSRTISAANGYALPENITVSGASHTWNQASGALSISNVTGDVTITIAGTCVTPTFAENGHPVSNTDYITTGSATALSYEASAAGASLTQQWQISSNNVDWADIDGATNATYTPNIATEGTKYYRVKVTNSACSSYSFSEAATITSTEPSGYCISVFNSDNNGIQNGFSNGGSGNEYTLDFTVPGKDGSSNWPQYWIGENNTYQDSYSATANFADMKFTSSNATLGLAEGAIGKLHIWNDNATSGSNLWVKFEPSGYGFRWGAHDNADWSAPACTKAFTVDANSANTYWTEMITLDGTNNTAWDYYVGLQAESGYVYSGVDDEEHDNRGISRTRSVTTMKVSNGTAGQYKETFLNSEATGTTGKFRIWNNNISEYNFVCHFVPFYQLKYDGNGGSGDMAAIPATPVSCEESAANRTVTVAANAFTAPTGKQFVKWNTAADGNGADVEVGEYVLTSNVTLYAIWEDINYTVTVNQSPNNAGATTEGQTSVAHYNGTVYLTTNEPAGYRFVNWTSSDVTITNPTSATTASFTMPNDNVEVTANFQAVCTVKWYVGGTTEDKKVAETTVDAGSKVAPPTDPLGTAIGACANTFMGWTTSEYRNGSVPQTAEYYETPLFKKAIASASLPTISEATSYYAVFAKNGGQVETNNYAKITSTDDLADGMKFVLVAVGSVNADSRAWPYSVMMNNTVSSNLLGKNDVTVTNNTVTLTNEDAGCVYTLEKSGEYYKIKDKDGKYIRRGTSKNTMLLTETAADGREFTIDFNDGNAVITIVNGDETDSTIYYNHNVSKPQQAQEYAPNPRFAIYKTAMQPVMIFKVQTEQGYSDYVTECAAVEAPVIALAGDTYYEEKSTTITCATDGATIRYTTDGTAPSKTNGSVYSDAITIDQSMTLKAIAYKDDDVSGVAEATYTLKVATPTITSSPKHFLSKTNVSIASTTGATIYYTTDGSTPTTESSVYSTPFEISATATITAYAIKSGWTDSEKSESVTFTKVNEEDILDVAGARAAITAGTNLNGRYVHGKIYNVASYNESHHSITYWISDSGEGSTSSKDGLQVYGGLAGDYMAQFNGTGDLSVGDEVVVWGNLKLHSGTTYELDVNNEIAKLMRDVVAPAFTPAGGGFLNNVHVTIASEEGATIYYTTNGDEPTNESTLYTNAGIDLSATTTIKTIAYKDAYNSSVITKKYTKGGTPLSVAEALAALDSNDPIDDQFVTGKVCTAPASAPSNGQLTYYIVDDLDDIQSNNKLEIYKGKDLGGANFDEQGDIQFGDVVTVFGQLKIHSGIKELNENNHLVAFERPNYPVTSIELNHESAAIEVEHTVNLTANVLPAYATTKTVQWSSSASGVASVTNAGVVTGVSAGEAVITVAATDGSNVAANCTITVYQWNLSGYTVTSAPATSYTVVDHFTKEGIVIKANYERSDTHETKQETVASSAWSAKLGDNAIEEDYAFALADNDKTLALYVEGVDDPVWDETISVAEAPKDQFVVGIWDITAPEDQTGTYNMPSLSNQTAAEGNCKDHNIFIGWVAEENADDLIDENIIAGGTEGIVAANKTYHAVWAKQVTGPRNFSIKYDWDGSTTGWGTSSSWSTNNNGKSGKCGSVSSTESIYTTSSYAKPKTFSVYLKRTSNNETNSWTIQYSKNNSTWNDIETIDFEDISKSDWSTLISVDVSAEDYNDCYFKLVKSGNANCLVDDVTLVYESTGTYNTDYRVDCSQRYTLSFDANGGNGSYDDAEKRENATITLPDGSALSFEYHDFAGWKVYYAGSDREDPESEITVTDNQFTMPASNVEAVAQWTEQAKGTISYVGDEIRNSSVTCYAGQKYKLRTEVTLPVNKKLIGWTIDGDETLYAPNQEMEMPNPIQNITYHVQIIDVVPEPKGMDISAGEWILVTNESQLHAGDFVVIVGNETTNAMGAQGNNFRDVAGVTKQNEGQNITLSNDVTPLFLQNGYMDGEFALYDMAYEKDEVVVGGYLYANSSSNNQMQTSNTYSSRDYSWKITIGDGNVASIVAQGANTRNVMQYNPNNGSPRFACYGSANLTGLQLYRYEGQRDVEVTENASATTIYIEDANVTVKEDVTLTIDKATNLNDLTIEAGGAVELDANKLTVVGMFAIETTMASGASGQLNGATVSNFAASGEAYIDITLGAGGTNQQWHAFTVPFPVDAMNGIYDLDGNKLVNETNYAIMDYHGDIRATGAYGWKKYRQTLVPGTFYIMATDGYRTTYRFKKKAGAALIAENSKEIFEYAKSGDGATTDAGWNGVGNPTLSYGKVDAEVQVLDPTSYTFVKKDANSTNFVVGTPFFYQAAAAGTIEMLTADASANYAPARMQAKGVEKIKVAFGNEDFTDYLDISASEEALNEYQIGKDLVKMTMTNTPSVAQIFGKAYNNKLCMVYAPMANDKAVYELSLYAPAEGKYTIAAPSDINADLYLTKNGRVIWNLTMMPYEIELSKGTTEGYGLLLHAKAPEVATGVEETESGKLKTESAQKVIIDEKVYILRSGEMYDITGKAVK